MSTLTTKSIRNIEEKMQGLDEGSLRYRIFESAKNFKMSWIDLGQVLYTVRKEKLYREWGYQDFEVYAAKEIGIRKETAMKLLRSYSFLENEEPRYLSENYRSEAKASVIPTYEAVDVLRKAKNKKGLEEEDYVAMKKKVLEEGRDSRTATKALTQMIKAREELSPEEAREKKNQMFLRRFLGMLKTVQREIELTKILPAKIGKDLEKVIDAVEAVVE